MNNNVLHIISGDLWGGAEVQMLHQISALLKEGRFECRVLMFSDSRPAQNYREAGIPVDIAPEQNGFRELLSTAKSLPITPSIIVAHGYKEATVAYLLSRHFRAKLILTFHGSTENYCGWKGLKIKPYLIIQSLIARFAADSLVACSKSLAKELNLPKEKTTVNYNVAANPEANESYNFERRPAAVIVGRLVPVKRVDIAIKAIEKNQAANLYVIGSGPEEPELRSLANTLGISERIHFMGFQDKATELIAGADVLLISSDSEGVPTVLLEALRRGTPVVSTELPGISEVMAHFPEFPYQSFPKGEVEEAAKSVDKAILIGKKHTCGIFKETAENLFSPTAAANRLTRLYKSILA